MKCRETLLSAITADRVLDAGCGVGRYTFALADHLASFKSIVGIDPSKNALDEARKQNEDSRVTFRQKSIFDLDPEPPRFEAVAISCTLHHIADPEAALERLVSILCPGGALIVEEMYSDGLTPAQKCGRDVHHFKAKIDRINGQVHDDTFTVEKVRALVAATGLPVENECAQQNTASGPAGLNQQQAIDFLESYLPFVEEHPEHPEMLREMRELQERIRTDGLESPPHLVVVARRPGP